MTLAVYVPAVICAALALSSAALSRRVAPAIGVWLFTAIAVFGALSVMWTLLLLVASLVDDVPWLVHGQPKLPVNDGISALACAALLWSCVRVGRVWFAEACLRRGLRSIPGDDLVVLPDERIIAFAAPGRAGRIIVSDSMLRALTSQQRRVLFAHERAHLDAYHPAVLIAAHLAAAANPVLLPVARAVGFLCERHADERAAAMTHDREGTAVALAAAALASRHGPTTHRAVPGLPTSGQERPGAVMAVPEPSGFDRTDVVERIGALRHPVRRRSRLVLAGVLVAIVMAVAAAIYATAAFITLLVQFLR
jgi:Zn-dependent protease with chaperone function